MRPASKTPLSALSLGEVFLEAGAPPAAVTVLPCRTELAEKLLEKIAGLTIGNPLEESTLVGGLIDEAAAEGAMSLIDEARTAGATILCGGTREGTVVAPTLLADVPVELCVCTDEAFAPIVVLERYDDVDHVIETANRSRFGLQAGLFTNDIRIIHRAFEKLEVGALIVNDANTFRVDQIPYGGVKQSGYGREGMRYAIREMTEERLLVIDPR